jgi:hypothetical protein
MGKLETVTLTRYSSAPAQMADFPNTRRIRVETAANLRQAPKHES